MKNHLQELRAARECSQSDLADKPGVSHQAINAIEGELLLKLIDEEADTSSQLNDKPSAGSNGLSWQEEVGEI